MATRKRKPAEAEEPTPKVTPEMLMTEDAVKEPTPKPASKKAAPRPHTTSAPLRALPRVNLDVYLLACGKKADQTAGFRRWAKKNTVRRQTIPEWEKLWETFVSRPM